MNYERLVINSSNIHQHPPSMSIGLMYEEVTSDDGFAGSCRRLRNDDASLIALRFVDCIMDTNCKIVSGRHQGCGFC